MCRRERLSQRRTGPRRQAAYRWSANARAETTKALSERPGRTPSRWSRPRKFLSTCRTLVSYLLGSFAVGVVQVRASQGRRGRDTGSYVDRGERREVRAWAARTVKRPRRHGTRASSVDFGWWLAILLRIRSAGRPPIPCQMVPANRKRAIPTAPATAAILTVTRTGVTLTVGRSSYRWVAVATVVADYGRSRSQ